MVYILHILFMGHQFPAPTSYPFTCEKSNVIDVQTVSAEFWSISGFMYYFCRLMILWVLLKVIADLILGSKEGL